MPFLAALAPVLPPWGSDTPPEAEVYNVDEGHGIVVVQVDGGGDVVR